MENDNKQAHLAANLDKTQMVSLQDLEELERLQLAGENQSEQASPRRPAFPLSAVFGVLLALLLVIALAAGYVLHERSAGQVVQSRSR